MLGQCTSGAAMIGSRLLGQQPTFGGADFGIPEIALFGYYQFRNAVPTSDTWEEHDGIEILFMQSGEACWDLPDDHFSMATGSQAVIFPAGRRHRISNGVYTPCRLLWMVFQPKGPRQRHRRASFSAPRSKRCSRWPRARNARSTCPRNATAPWAISAAG